MPFSTLKELLNQTRNIETCTLRTLMGIRHTSAQVGRGTTGCRRAGRVHISLLGLLISAIRPDNEELSQETSCCRRSDNTELAAASLHLRSTLNWPLRGNLIRLNLARYLLDYVQEENVLRMSEKEVKFHRSLWPKLGQSR